MKDHIRYIFIVSVVVLFSSGIAIAKPSFGDVINAFGSWFFGQSTIQDFIFTTSGWFSIIEPEDQIGDLNKSCKKDTDCTLIDNSINYSKCYAGACGIINYSQKRYISVNKYAFLDWKEKIGPKGCGAPPLCPPKIVNDDFKARCINKVCKKKHL